jgi:hypothetical protein
MKNTRFNPAEDFAILIIRQLVIEVSINKNTKRTTINKLIFQTGYLLSKSRKQAECIIKNKARHGGDISEMVAY